MTFRTRKPRGSHSPGQECPAFRSTAGFSLTEMVVVSAIILMITSGSYLSLQPVLKAQHVTTAYNATLMTLRRARDQAAADMRVYVVTFAAPGTVTVTQNSPAGPVLITTILPQDVTFHLEPGLPNSPTVAPTTPDGFGTASNAIDFDQGVGLGGATSIYFQPDGTAVDINGNINNGVVYMARVGDLKSSRAITLWGTTGRIRGWRLLPNGGGVIWRQQ
jgi:prepilin-type N-terminal cleavage/methylation domain-containing protein